jgi:predicted peptidase
MILCLKRTVVLFNLLFLAFIPFAMAQSFASAIYTQEGEQLPYRILLPENYNPTTSYPLVVFLHGAGERGTDNALQLLHGSDLFLASEFRKTQPAIVVFPQCPEGAYWATILDRPDDLKFNYPKKPKENPILDLVDGLIEEIIDRHPINEDRIYIGGLSMGGMGTFEMVYRNPRKFAAAFAICGGANPKIARKIRRPKWRIDHGEVDEVVPLVLSQRMVQALKKKKAEVIFNVYDGVNHDSWNKVFDDPYFLPWLFSQSK